MTWEVDGEKDPALFIRGANAVDVGGSSVKDYKLNFLSLRSGNYKFTVTFKSQQSGEYVFFVVNVTVEEPALAGTIELTSTVRESVSSIINIENPTDVDITIPSSEFVCENEYIEITPESLKIPSKSEKGFEVHYRPLIAKDMEESELTLTNSILGVFKYQLNLKGLAPSTQRSMAFKCALGADLVQVFKFTHFLKKPTTYTVKVERIDNPNA